MNISESTMNEKGSKFYRTKKR